MKVASFLGLKLKINPLYLVLKTDCLVNALITHIFFYQPQIVRGNTCVIYIINLILIDTSKCVAIVMILGTCLKKK